METEKEELGKMGKRRKGENGNGKVERDTTKRSLLPIENPDQGQ